MSKESIGTLVVLGVIVLAAGWYAFMLSQEAREANSAAGKALATPEAIEAQYTDVDGNPIDLSAFAGKVRVVNTWASWCPYCVQELPDLQQLAAEYAEQDVVVIAMNRKESQGLVRAYIDSHELTGDVLFVLDPDDTFYRSVGGFAMPETVFYDEKGNVSFHKHGFMKLEEMRKHTEKALAADE